MKGIDLGMDEICTVEVPLKSKVSVLAELSTCLINGE